MKRTTSLDLLAAMLILLYVYTASSKMMRVDLFEVQLARQALPDALKKLLVWTLPEMEMLTAILLIFKRSRYFAFWLSAFLMTAFTLYISLVLFHSFGTMPCSCGGVFASMGWPIHLWFNLIFLLSSYLGIYLQRKEVHAFQ